MSVEIKTHCVTPSEAMVEISSGAYDDLILRCLEYVAAKEGYVHADGQKGPTGESVRVKILENAGFRNEFVGFGLKHGLGSTNTQMREAFADLDMDEDAINNYDAHKDIAEVFGPWKEESLGQIADESIFSQLGYETLDIESLVAARRYNDGIVGEICQAIRNTKNRHVTGSLLDVYQAMPGRGKRMFREIVDFQDLGIEDVETVDLGTYNLGGALGYLIENVNGDEKNHGDKVWNYIQGLGEEALGIDNLGTALGVLVSADKASEIASYIDDLGEDNVVKIDNFGYTLGCLVEKNKGQPLPYFKCLEDGVFQIDNLVCALSSLISKGKASEVMDYIESLGKKAFQIEGLEEILGRLGNTELTRMAVLRFNKQYGLT